MYNKKKQGKKKFASEKKNKNNQPAGERMSSFQLDSAGVKQVDFL